MKEIQSMYSRFRIIGVPKINKEKFYGEGKSESGYTYSRVNFGIKTSETNMVFVEMMGGFFENNPVIKTKNQNGDDIEVKWANRFNEDIVDDVANYRKSKINLGNDKKREFLSDYDAVQFLHENLSEDFRIAVTGNIVTQRYKDKNNKYQVTKKFVIKNVRLASEDEADEATCVCKFVYDHEAWDDSSLEENRKIYISGYETVREKSVNGNIFVPTQFVIDCSNVDFDNPDNVAFLQYYKECFQSEIGVVKETEWHGIIVRGAEEVALTEEDLTDNQRMQIQLGIATMEDFINDMRNGKMKDKVNEIRLIRPTNAYDGDVSVETEYEEEDFYIQEGKVENMDDVLGGNKGAKAENADKGGDLASRLFGGN